MVVRLDRHDDVHADAIGNAICSKLRFADIVGYNGSNEFIVLFPEISITAMIPARRVLHELNALDTKVSCGIAVFPIDGSDADSLLTSARHAAGSASPGTIAMCSELSAEIELDESGNIAVDPKMIQLFSLARKLAASSIPVLVVGETGVGKEVFASAIHRWSDRRDTEMVTINCAALPETLLESELFGHEKGAFSGADSLKPGLLETAAQCTVLLDEVTESSLATQAKLLRVLETGRIRRLGSVKEKKIDVRIIAATNRDINERVASGRFRQDLYYRLNAAMITIPPLRDRMLDLPVLARHYLAAACEELGRAPMTISKSALRWMQSHNWPGNVRELKNLLSFVATTTRDAVLKPEHFRTQVASKTLALRDGQRSSIQPAQTVPSETAFCKLADEIAALEKKRVSEALLASDGVRVRAAELLGMPLRTFVSKVKTYGLSSIPSRRRRKQRKDLQDGRVTDSSS
ncbi:MAG: AAA domain-containing protein [Deltaproteobacteria bacterium]|nr:AAA domain-containing protein [Deltaproteobacteria bacterium]